jgi:transglutaminase-like putative cysteine protease
MFVIHSFDPLISRRVWYLTVYLFLALVLVARVTFLHQHNRWKISQTALPPHLGLDILRFTILATSVIVLFAWTVPALANAVPAAERAWQPVRRAWNETRDRFDNAFASLRSSVSPVSDYYGKSALLGRGNPLSDTQMFSVNVPADIPTSLRIYWRARTYETYERGQWLSTAHLNYAYNPENDNLRVPESQGRWLGSFEFVSATHMITLFTPAQPLWVNRPGQVEYAKNPDGTLDIATFRAVPSLEPGQVYKAQASVNHASLAELRAAGNEYPSWVTERYLQLPDTITSRTRQLAEEITAGLDTPYDKVNAVTNYLRENITYVDTIDQDPPRDQEIIDWFLFDLKQGFCNYYSTAEIVLLRSLGIPARWAIGFAQGERVAEETVPGTRFEENSYIVRQRDAHAWPEIYFPGIGWVEFEPTTSQPEIARLTGEDRNGNPNLLSESNEERQLRDYEDEMALLREERLAAQESQQNRSNVVYWLLAWALIGASLIYLVWRFRTRINITAMPIMLEAAFVKIGIRPPKSIQLWARSVELPPLVKAYTEINRALSRLGESPAVTRTPAERAEHLAQLMPSTDTYAQRLVNEYQIGIFSRQLPNMAVALRAATEIRRQSLRAFLQRLFARLQRPLRFTG